MSEKIRQCLLEQWFALSYASYARVKGLIANNYFATAKSCLPSKVPLYKMLMKRRGQSPMYVHSG